MRGRFCPSSLKIWEFQSKICEFLIAILAALGGFCVQHLFFAPYPSVASALHPFLFWVFSWARAAPFSLFSFPSLCTELLPAAGPSSVSCPTVGSAAVPYQCFHYKCYFPGAPNQVIHICLGLEPGLLGKVSDHVSPRCSVWNLITVSSASFPVEKVGSGHFQMPFRPNVCMAWATVKETPPSPLVLPIPPVIKHRMCWSCQEAWKCTLFPELLSFTQQRGLTFKINLRGKVISFRMLALEYPQWPLLPCWCLFDEDSQAVSEPKAMQSYLLFINSGTGPCLGRPPNAL